MGRPIHGYRISQLFSSKVDPSEILKEYRTTHYADRFYNLKIGIPWADLERRLDIMSVLRLCSEAVMPARAEGAEPTGTYSMGIDTGRQLHVVVLKRDGEQKNRQHVVHLSVCHNFEDLDAILARYRVTFCVIDGLPETHETRKFAGRHRGVVFMNFFSEHQRGDAAWNHLTYIVQVNRTEALDASRQAVREKRLVLPRQTPIVAEFARHLTADAKVLTEDEETGAQRYRLHPDRPGPLLARVHLRLDGREPVHERGGAEAHLDSLRQEKGGPVVASARAALWWKQPGSTRLRALRFIGAAVWPISPALR
jgi:hypothetical protein